MTYIFSVKRLTTVTLKNRIFLRTVFAVIMTVNERDVIMTRGDKFNDRYRAYLTNMKFIIGKYPQRHAPACTLDCFAYPAESGTFFSRAPGDLVNSGGRATGTDIRAVRGCDSSIRLIRLRARPVSVIAQTGMTYARVTMRNNTKVSRVARIFVLFI